MKGSEEYEPLAAYEKVHNLRWWNIRLNMGGYAIPFLNQVSRGYCSIPQYPFSTFPVIIIAADDSSHSSIKTSSAIGAPSRYLTSIRMSFVFGYVKNQLLSINISSKLYIL